VPVVVMSGGGEKEMAQSALKMGAYDYVSKPFNLEYLETVVLTKVLVGLES
jgi:two-component system NtrC family response regulator